MGREHHDRILHGLRVRSEVPLEGVVPPLPFASADLTISLVESIVVPDDAPKVLQYDFDENKSVSAVQTTDGATIVTFSQACSFRITSDKIEISPHTRDDLDLAIILLQGWVMSMTLALRECLVLHASAVETDLGCVAMVGESGSGKSTLTAMLLRDGARLVSDDVLRVAPDGSGGWAAYPGITALRLRPKAAELAADLAQKNLTHTVDDRLLVRCARTSADPIKLTAVLFPEPSQTTPTARIEWLPTKFAAIELDQCPRVYDWTINGPARFHFGQVVQLAADVPVGNLSVPWGPPWATGLLENIENMVLAQIRS